MTRRARGTSDRSPPGASDPCAGRRDTLRWIGALGVGACGSGLPGLAMARGEPKVTTIARGLQSPWGLAFLPGGAGLLVTERRGQLVRIGPDAHPTPVSGLPELVVRGQGGLLDVALDPDFEREPWVYLSCSEAGSGEASDGNAGTAVARGRLVTSNGAPRLEAVEVIFRQTPKVDTGNHFGSRLVFDRGGRLFITLGDRYRHRDLVQLLDNTIGKVVRIERDGRVPADNPFVGQAGARGEIWSYGHRNVQGAALHPQTGELWTHEHGPQGGDEVNVTLPGRNYGWPVITQGREYGLGTRIGEGIERADVEPAVTTWIPSIAPSGMAFVTSARYPAWQGSLLVGALRGQALVRLELDGRRVVREERMLTTLFERIRDVRQGPDGYLYLLTDNSDGRVLRLEP